MGVFFFRGLRPRAPFCDCPVSDSGGVPQMGNHFVFEGSHTGDDRLAVNQEGQSMSGSKLKLGSNWILERFDRFGASETDCTGSGVQR
jgi:hypothetical protein